MPTKTEQADLLMAMFGRHGEAPVAVVAPQSPSDCFETMLEAARMALQYRTPVMLLSDGYIRRAVEVLEKTGIRRAAIAGGDTSGYATRRMGIEALEVKAPFAPAMPMSRAHAPGTPLDGLEVVFKGGQTGKVDFFEGEHDGFLVTADGHRVGKVPRGPVGNIDDQQEGDRLAVGQIDQVKRDLVAGHIGAGDFGRRDIGIGDGADRIKRQPSRQGIDQRDPRGVQ
jgi:2-oxoglutarate ferredoxin oxidoreductase subunit alpha